MERDIFEDVRKLVGCIYISDLPHRKRDVLAAMRKINFSDYTQEKMIELLEYVFQDELMTPTNSKHGWEMLMKRCLWWRSTPC